LERRRLADDRSVRKADDDDAGHREIVDIIRKDPPDVVAAACVDPLAREALDPGVSDE
jgi:hypothetical protein